MSDYNIGENLNPVFPCICGHLITTHGEEMDVQSSWEWDDDHNEEVEIQSSYPRAVCYTCEADCYFVEMTNLEYLEWKSLLNDYHQR